MKKLDTAEAVLEWAARLSQTGCGCCAMENEDTEIAEAEYLALCVSYYEGMMFLGNHPVVGKLSPERILENERLRVAWEDAHKPWQHVSIYESDNAYIVSCLRDAMKGGDK